jgi:predicted metal-dependent TIM-barrel fold hydrolase
MKMIDPHLHIESRPREELEIMAAAGITAVISHSYYPHLNLPLKTSSTLFDALERVQKFEAWRTSQHEIKLFLAVSINPVSVPEEYDQFLGSLGALLESDRVVAMGELGLEPGSKTCPDMAKQREILKLQLEVAKEKDVVVVFHTPHVEKKKWADEYFDTLQAIGVKPSNVVIDHADETIAGEIIAYGAYAGITVQPWRNFGPANAVSVIEKCGTERILVDSDCNSTMFSDSLSVPKTGLELRRRGFSDKDVDTVLFHNPVRLFKLQNV